MDEDRDELAERLVDFFVDIEKMVSRRERDPYLQQDLEDAARFYLAQEHVLGRLLQDPVVWKKLVFSRQVRRMAHAKRYLLSPSSV